MCSVSVFSFSMVPAGGPRKFQRRSCAGILGVPRDGRSNSRKIPTRICGQMRSPPLYFTSFCIVPNIIVFLLHSSPAVLCLIDTNWFAMTHIKNYQNMFRYNVIGQEVGKLSFRLYGKNMVAIVIINKNDLSCIISTRWGSSTPVVGTACCPSLGWHQETCLETRFNLHRPTICLLTLKAEGFTMFYRCMAYAPHRCLHDSLVFLCVKSCFLQPWTPNVDPDPSPKVEMLIGSCEIMRLNHHGLFVLLKMG